MKPDAPRGLVGFFIFIWLLWVLSLATAFWLRHLANVTDGSLAGLSLFDHVDFPLPPSPYLPLLTLAGWNKIIYKALFPNATIYCAR